MKQVWGVPAQMPSGAVLDDLHAAIQRGDEDAPRRVLLACGVREDELERDETEVWLRHAGRHDIRFLPKALLAIAEIWDGDVDHLVNVLRHARRAALAARFEQAFVLRELLLRRIEEELFAHQKHAAAPPERPRRLRPSHLRLVPPPKNV